MRGRWLLIVAGLILVAAGMGLAYRQREGAARACNLILISIDTLRADHLGCYGYKRRTSPRIDAFAARGVTFLNAISSSSWTVPAHMTLLTGLEPVAHQLIDYPFAGRLGSEYITAAEALREHGFRTAAFTGGGFVSAQHGFEIGFETFASRGRRFEENLPLAREWLEGLRADERFFLFLHGFNTHKPYKPPAPYDRTFCPDYAGEYDTRDFQPENSRPTAEDLEFVICQYDGEIAYVDELIGEFLGELESKGILKETLVVITSDHGDEFYEHGNVDHIHTLYDELIRVPLILVGPGLRVKVVRGQVGLIDVIGSVFELLGVSDPFPGQGAGLLAAFRETKAAPESGGEEPDESRAVYSFTGFSEYPYHLSSVRAGRWKLVVWSLAGMRGIRLEGGTGFGASGAGGRPDDQTINRSSIRPNRERYTYKFRDRAEDFVELFDLRADPGEQHDVSAKYPHVVRRLADMLKRRIDESREHVRSAGREGAPGPEYLEALRALGYTAGGSQAESGPSSDGRSR